MNIGILGYESNNSFTPLIAQALNEMGHFVTRFSVNKVKTALSPFKVDDHLKNKQPYSLRSAIIGYEDQLDFLIVAQSFMHHHNDLAMPVVYYHTELTSPLTVKTPTHIAMKLPEMENFLHSYFPWEWFRIKHHFVLYPSAHPPHFAPDKQKDINISLLGAPSDMFDRKRDWIWNMMQADMNEIRDFYRLKDIGAIFDDLGDIPANFPTYNITMWRSQHMVLTAHKGVYIGRRVFECLASKTIPIIWIENDVAEDIYHSLGFKENGKQQNCYFFRKKYDLLKFKGIEYDPNIAQRGYDLLLDNHTFGHRALQIMKEMDRTLVGWKAISPLPTQEEVSEQQRKTVKAQ